MLKTLSLGLLLALASAAHLPEVRDFTCQECIDEMHHLGGLVKGGANDMMGFLKEEYCPTLEGHEEQCQQDLVMGYVQMLEMVVHHFFMDGAIHICTAWNICHADSVLRKDPRPYTCEECVQGLDIVGAYMQDPLWIAEYTLYLQQNFCVGQDADLGEHCEHVIGRHFPAMHELVIDEFWNSEDLCNMQPVCGGEEPTKPPTKPPTQPPTAA